MSQFDPIIGADKSGLAYRQDDNDGKKALLNHHKGSSAPGYAEAGTLWLDDAATPWVLKLYDGADWVTIGNIHAGDDEFTPFFNGAALQEASTSSAGLAERATDGEAKTGTDTSRYITPSHQAMVLLDTQTASGDSAIEFTGFATGYSSYLFVADHLTVSSDNADVLLRTSSDGGSNYDSGSTDYARVNMRFEATGSVYGIGNSQPYMIASTGDGIGNAANEFASFSLQMFGASDAVYTSFISQALQVDGNSLISIGQSGGYRKDAAVVDGVQFLMNAGNLTGTIKMYGVK